MAEVVPARKMKSGLARFFFFFNLKVGLRSVFEVWTVSLSVSHSLIRWRSVVCLPLHF